LAEAVQRLLEYDAYCTVWPQGIFTAGEPTLVDLMSAVREHDYGIFICTPDDITRSRSLDSHSPRDNVLLEAGMFLGRYGIGRGFIIAPRDIPNFRLPSDFRGITVADYESERLKSGKPDGTLGTACSTIKAKIQSMPNPATELEFCVSHQIQSPTYTFPSKIWVDIYNKSQCDVVLRAKFFRYGDKLRPSPKANPLGQRDKKEFPLKFIGRSNIHDRESVLLLKGDSTNCYVPVDPDESSDAVQAAIASKGIADLHMVGYWLDETTRIQYIVNSI
jgi:hypothetical protein